MRGASVYRPDIDGLRAIAVLVVIAYHVGWQRMRGGFVGVDVFFVISGYLLSSQILSELATSRFSIASFYERRIRRIFPALFVMIFVTTVPAMMILLPSELLDFARSSRAAALSVSNVYFLAQAGYFDRPAATKPLLHTWSLGVEEQFYLFLPLTLMALWRLRATSVRQAVTTLALLSLGSAVVLMPKYQAASFYLAPLRAWELLLGTMLALSLFPPVRARLLRECATAIGVLLIVLSAALYTPEMPFPGLAAVPPCVGAALVITGGQAGPSLATRALSLKPMVGIGLISYSLYLWHWPIVVFAGMGAAPFGMSGLRVKLILVVTSLILGAISWRLVEVPFRTGRLRLTRRPLFATAAAVMAMALVVSTLLVASGGLPARFPPAAVQVASYLTYNYDVDYRTGTCFLDLKHSLLDFRNNRATCLQGDRGKPSYLLLGDSHAAHLWAGLAHTNPEANVLQANGAGCKIVATASEGDENCRALMGFVFDEYLVKQPVSGVLLAARWTAGDLPSLAETIAWFRQRGIPVTVLGPVPQYDSPLPRLLALELKNDDSTLAFSHRVVAVWAVDQQMARLAATEWRVSYVSLIQALCDRASCTKYAGAAHSPVQFDYGHLTKEGSVFLGERLRATGRLRLPPMSEGSVANELALPRSPASTGPTVHAF